MRATKVSDQTFLVRMDEEVLAFGIQVTASLEPDRSLRFPQVPSFAFSTTRVK